MRPNSTDRQTRGKVLKDGQSKQSRPPVANKTIAKNSHLSRKVAAQQVTAFRTEPDPNGNGAMRLVSYTCPDGTKLNFRLQSVLRRYGRNRGYMCAGCRAVKHYETIHVSADGQFFLADPMSLNHMCSAGTRSRTPVGQNNDRSSDSEEEEDVAREKGQSPADVAHAEATPDSDQTATTTTPSQRSVPAGPAAGRVPAIKQETDNNGNAEDATRPVAHSCPRFRIPPPFNALRPCASAVCPRRVSAAEPRPTAAGPRPTAAGPRPTAAGPRPTAAGPRPSAAGSPAWLQNVMPLVESELAALDPARSVEIRHGLLGFIYRELVPEFGRGQYQI